MKLLFIKTERCPVCGCDIVVKEEIQYSNYENRKNEIREHANGGRWETRRFLCGHEIEYIPNFSKEFCKNKCKHDPDVIMRENKIKEIDEKLIGFCKENKIPVKSVSLITHLIR